jgi:hypothetical protein
MNGKIPITFTHNGVTYTGTLDPVFGAGANTWHIMINSYYRGRLRLVEGDWFCDGDFSDLAEYFGQYLIAYFQ